MRNIKKRLISFIAESVNCVAPYTVRNTEFGKEHFAWTFNGAVEWLKCYDAGEFGKTYIFDFHGELIASKGI